MNMLEYKAGELEREPCNNGWFKTQLPPESCRRSDKLIAVFAVFALPRCPASFREAHTAVVTFAECAGNKVFYASALFSSQTKRKHVPPWAQV